MTNKQQQIPAIRFNGFTDTWEQRKLGGIFDYEQPTKYIVKSTEYDDNFDTPVLTAGKSFLLGYTDEISGIKHANIDNPVVIFDDFTTGSHYVDFPFKIKSSAMKLLILKDNSDNFYFMFNILKNIKYVPQSHERHWISKFSDFEVYKPSQEEQTRIGSFLKNLDNTITLHQRQLNKYNKLKKTLLQKMFPKSGEKSPEIRFDGFVEEWKQCKLDQIVIERNQQVPESIDYPLMSFTAMDGVTPKSDRYNREFLVKSDNKKYKKTELGDLIYSSNNLDVGSIGINKTGNAVISPVYSIFYTRDGVTPEFVDMLIQRKDFINKMIQFRQGVVYGQWRIHESDFLKIETRIPSSKEQIKLGSLFKQIDNTIAFHQQKVNDYQKLKGAILKKMFI